jgi:hypothetical protein
MGRLDSAELSEWIAYDNVHGLPDRHATALLLATIAVANAWRKAPLRLSDVLPLRKGRPRRQSAAEMAAIMRGLAGGA